MANHSVGSCSRRTVAVIIYGSFSSAPDKRPRFPLPLPLVLLLPACICGNVPTLFTTHLAVYRLLLLLLCLLYDSSVGCQCSRCRVVGGERGGSLLYLAQQGGRRVSHTNEVNRPQMLSLDRILLPAAFRGVCCLLLSDGGRGRG